MHVKNRVRCSLRITRTRVSFMQKRGLGIGNEVYENDTGRTAGVDSGAA